MLPGIKSCLKIMNLCIAAPLMSAMNNKHDMGLYQAMDLTNWCYKKKKDSKGLSARTHKPFIAF